MSGRDDGTGQPTRLDRRSAPGRGLGQAWVGQGRAEEGGAERKREAGGGDWGDTRTD